MRVGLFIGRLVGLCEVCIFRFWVGGEIGSEGAGVLRVWKGVFWYGLGKAWCLLWDHVLYVNAWEWGSGR